MERCGAEVMCRGGGVRRAPIESRVTDAREIGSARGSGRKRRGKVVGSALCPADNEAWKRSKI